MACLVDITDLSVEDIDKIIALAEDIRNNPIKYVESCKHKILATLFYEPSTRTRLSFESAMISLGGSVIGFSGASASSATKGETIADTVSVVSGYADVIAMRHNLDGAAYVAAAKSKVPFINAGDGGHFHPTQTLADLLTIHSRLGRLNGLKIGICGDLKYGRTTHSLIAALSRYADNEFVLISPPELRLPDFAKKHAGNCAITESESLENSIADLNVLYMTRIQKERFDDSDEYMRLKGCFILDAEKMRLAKENMIVMHPLPRVDEITVDVDEDDRAAYFYQTECGRYMRMALILSLLDKKISPAITNRKLSELNVPCANPHCVTHFERGVKSLFYSDVKTFRCAYCDSQLKGDCKTFKKFYEEPDTQCGE